MAGFALKLDVSRLQSDASGLLAACSGGLDSTVLLHVLSASPLRARGLRAIHVHHGLHPDADAWAAHCQRSCDKLGVPLQVAYVQVARDGGTGPEAAAREARYAAFKRELAADEILVQAHHRDDQVETYLLRALRASGPDGLGAMRPWRAFGGGWLWRPLLSTPRADLLAYAQSHGLSWIDDPSNADAALDRNFLRLHVLPLLRERWKHADAAFFRSAMLCAQASALLESEDAQALATAQSGDPRTLDVAALSRLPPARLARVLRRWIAGLGLRPLPASGVERIQTDLLDAPHDSDARFDWSGATVRRWRNLLHAGLRHDPLPAGWQAQWDGCTPLPLPDGGTLALQPNEASLTAPGSVMPPAFGRTLTVHARQGGERIVLPGRTHSHALKHVLQDRNVPSWVREHLPLLSDGDGTLLAAGNLVYSSDFDAWLHDKGFQLTWSLP